MGPGSEYWEFERTVEKNYIDDVHTTHCCSGRLRFFYVQFSFFFSMFQLSVYYVLLARLAKITKKKNKGKKHRTRTTDAHHHHHHHHRRFA